MSTLICDLPDGELAVVTGTLHDLTKRITKQGRTWASADLTCGDTTIELLVFPVPYEELGHLLAEGAEVTLSCRMDRRDDTPRLMVVSPGMLLPGRVRPLYDPAMGDPR